MPGNCNQFARIWRFGVKRLVLLWGRESNVRGNIAAQIIERDHFMKKMLALSALAALAACSQPAPAPDASVTADASADATDVAAAPTNIAADGKPTVGKYEVTRPNGKKYMTEAKADGTYAVTAEGKVVETGKWEQKSPEQYCETADKPDAKQKCYNEKVDAKGVYTSTDPDNGEVAVVVRVVG